MHPCWKSIHFFKKKNIADPKLLNGSVQLNIYLQIY